MKSSDQGSKIPKIPKNPSLEHKYQDWLPAIIALAKTAGALISTIYKENLYSIRSKSDSSPVTEADIRSNEVIQQGLSALTPSLPILSEEGAEIPEMERQQWEYYWLVDPLDGTKEFIKGTDEFTVNIALIRNHVPVMGVVFAPILKHMYWSVTGQKAYFQEGEKDPVEIRVSSIKIAKNNNLQDKSEISGKSDITGKTGVQLPQPIKIAVSRHHHKKGPGWSQLLSQLEHLGGYELVYCGSALKLCLVARGIVDLYPRFGSTSEWDTAAGQCILESAGGKLVDLKGRSLKYNLRSTLVNPDFLAIGCVDLLPYIVDNSV